MKNINVMLVEDSVEDAFLITRYIEKINKEQEHISITIRHSFSLEEMAPLMADHEYDIILLDLSLPDGSGLETINYVVNHFELPVVVLTGFTDLKFSMKAIDSGVQDYINKNELSSYLLSRSILFGIERYSILREIDSVRVSHARALKMATLGEASAKIAHEINNPLTIILGHADMALRYLNKGDLNLEKVKSSLNTVLNTTQRIAKVIKGLKKLARVDGSTLEKEVVLLGTIIENALVINYERFSMASIDIKLDIHSECEIYCSDVQLIQVFLNLLSNSYGALKNDSKDKKFVEISTELSEDKEVGSCISIRFSDSGEILDQKVKYRMLQTRFTTKSKDEGLGLGLGIVKEIIKEHKGSIDLVPTSNTTFLIKIPRVSK